MRLRNILIEVGAMRVLTVTKVKRRGGVLKCGHLALPAPRYPLFLDVSNHVEVITLRAAE